MEEKEEEAEKKKDAWAFRFVWSSVEKEKWWRQWVALSQDVSRGAEPISFVLGGGGGGVYQSEDGP